MIWPGGTDNGDADAPEGLQLAYTAAQVCRITSDAYLATVRVVDGCCRKQEAKTPPDTTEATTRPFMPDRAQTRRKQNDNISRMLLPRSMDLPNRYRKMALDETAITYCAANPQPNNPKA